MGSLEKELSIGKLPDSKPRLSRALCFSSTEGLVVALEVLDALRRDGYPVEYHPSGGENSPAALLSEVTYRRLVPLLQSYKVEFEEAEVVSMNSLTPEEQAKLRGWNRVPKKF